MLAAALLVCVVGVHGRLAPTNRSTNATAAAASAASTSASSSTRSGGGGKSTLSSSAADTTATAAPGTAATPVHVDINISDNSFTVSPNPRLCGHVHIAKTGGTSLNGMLALKANGVCGHKGYSRDYAAFNQAVSRAQGWLSISDKVTTESRSMGLTSGPFNRGRIPHKIMAKRGYTDCKYISVEANWTFWRQYPLIELHVPCRDPIEHLLSQCNHYRRVFRCDPQFYEEDIDRCLMGMNRFGTGLFNLTGVTLKCYPFHEQFTTYLPMMVNLLTASPHVNDTYHSRPTNGASQNTCSFSPSEAAVIVRILRRKWSYYKFCESCVPVYESAPTDAPTVTTAAVATTIATPTVAPTAAPQSDFPRPTNKRWKPPPTLSGQHSKPQDTK